jgi:hypothetical protein
MRSRRIRNELLTEGNQGGNVMAICRQCGCNHPSSWEGHVSMGYNPPPRDDAKQDKARGKSLRGLEVPKMKARKS